MVISTPASLAALAGAGVANLVVQYVLGGHPKASTEVDREKELTLWGPAKILERSFCGKTQHAVQKLLAGPGVHICDECVEAYSVQSASAMAQSTESDLLKCSFCGITCIGVHRATESKAQICQECIQMTKEIFATFRCSENSA